MKNAKYALLLVLLIAFIVKMADSFVSSRHSEVNTESVKKVEVNTQKNLNLTFTNFIDNYRAWIAEHRTTQFSLTDLYWKENSDIKTFYCYLGYTVVISGDIDSKTDKLLNITVGCEPKRARYEKDALDLCTMIYTISIMALNPNLNRDNADAIINKLCANLKNSSIVVNNIKYQSTIYNGILMFSVKPKNL